MLNILSPSKNQASNYPDIITHFIAYLLLLVPSIDMRIEDIAVISRQISLGLVGVIILSSMRLVLRGVTRVSTSNLLLNISHLQQQALRVTSRNLGASLMLLILAQLMVCRFPHLLPSHMCSTNHSNRCRVYIFSPPSYSFARRSRRRRRDQMLTRPTLISSALSLSTSSSDFCLICPSW